MKQYFKQNGKREVVFMDGKVPNSDHNRLIGPPAPLYSVSEQRMCYKIELLPLFSEKFIL